MYIVAHYILIFAVEMDVSLKKRTASSRWHVFGKTVWKYTKKGKPLFAKKESDQNTLITERFSVAWKWKLKTKLKVDITGHIPKEISRAVSFFINHGDKVTGSVYSPYWFPSSIATKRFKLLQLQTEASKPFQRLKDIIQKNYDEPIKVSVQPI